MIDLRALIARSSSSIAATTTTATLSDGAVAGIAIGGSIVVFLIIGPVLIVLARWQHRHRAAAVCPVSSLPFTNDVSASAEGDATTAGPKKLQKKNRAAAGVLEMDDAARAVRHLSLPILPALPRPGSFSFGSLGFGGAGIDNKANSSSSVIKKGRRARSHTVNTAGLFNAAPGSSSRSPEKQRGYLVYQNRRKASWIDEDALHGPRVSPSSSPSSSPTKRKRQKSARKSSWFINRGITRALSRHLSMRRHHHDRNEELELELERSPTLPYTEPAAPGKTLVGSSSFGYSQGQNSASVGLGSRRAEMGYPHMSGALRYQQYGQQQHQQQASSAANTHIRIINPGVGPQRVPLPLAVKAINRITSSTIAIDGQQHPCLRRGSGTEADLQTILRRTAERLEDGSPSARRQTLLLRSSLTQATVTHTQGQRTTTERERVCGCGKEHAHVHNVDSAAFPISTRNPKTLSNVTQLSELEGCSPAVNSSPQGPSPSQSHKRTHTRQISHVSGISQMSVLSEPDSMAVSVSRTSSQTDVVQTALSSPSRVNHASPVTLVQTQQAAAHSYSPASSQSSGLSTVYSEEEAGGEMDDEAVNRHNAQTIRADDSSQPSMHEMIRSVMKDVGSPRHHGNHHHTRQGTLGNMTTLDVIPHTQSLHSKEPHRYLYGPRASPKTVSAFAVQGLQKAIEEDPFTACATPERPVPQRLSQVFSPLPAELPGEVMNPAVHVTGPEAGSPSRSSPAQRRRVMPPPYRLRPTASSPTLGHYQDEKEEEREREIQVRHVPGQSQGQLQIRSPLSREPSPVVSESGLSSVYDSYRYSRSGSGGESPQGLLALGRMSSLTMITMPTTAHSSPTKSTTMTTTWSEDVLASSFTGAAANNPPEGQRAKGKSPVIEFRAGDLSLASSVVNNADSGVEYTHIGSPSRHPNAESAFEERRVLVVEGETGRTTIDDAAIPRSSQHQFRQVQRGLSFSALSTTSATSNYSQDDDEGDILPPLLMMAPQTKSHALRVMNTVAELRRMNSQVSSYSAASTGMNAATAPPDASPTLPTLRGGGFSPSRHEAGSGSKNYLSLGKSGSPKAGDSVKGHLLIEPKTLNETVSTSHHRVTELGSVEIKEDGGGDTNNCLSPRSRAALRRGGVSTGRSRRNTVVTNFEQDLDRARQVLRESRGLGNTRAAISETPRRKRDEEGVGEDKRLVTHATKLLREEGRVSLESLGMYDEDGFLKNPTAKQA